MTFLENRVSSMEMLNDPILPQTTTRHWTGWAINEAINATPGTHACNLIQKYYQMTILPTACVQVIGRNKQIHNRRALLDTGGHINADTAKACKTLGLEAKPSNGRIIGVNRKDSIIVGGSLKLIPKTYSEIIPKTAENLTSTA